LSRLVSAYFLSHNTIHSTSRILFIRSAEYYCGGEARQGDGGDAWWQVGGEEAIGRHGGGPTAGWQQRPVTVSSQDYFFLVLMDFFYKNLFTLNFFMRQFFFNFFLISFPFKFFLLNFFAFASNLFPLNFFSEKYLSENDIKVIKKKKIGWKMAWSG